MATKPNHASIYKKVPALLRELREATGMTQRDLASKLKQEQYFIARCETGSRRIDVAEFVAWCSACRVDPKAGLDRLTSGR